MMLIEFTARTGYKPTPNEYKDIEEAYNATDLNKDLFCAAWKEANRGRIADQRRAEKRFREIEETYSKDNDLYWALSTVCRISDITTTKAEKIIEYTQNRQRLIELKGTPVHPEIPAEFLEYAYSIIEK